MNESSDPYIFTHEPLPYRRARAGQPATAASEGTASARNILQHIGAEQQPDNQTGVAWYEVTEDEINEAEEVESGMQMLAYCLIALALTGLAITLSFVIAAH